MFKTTAARRPAGAWFCEFVPWLIGICFGFRISSFGFGAFAVAPAKGDGVQQRELWVRASSLGEKAGVRGKKLFERFKPSPPPKITQQKCGRRYAKARSSLRFASPTRADPRSFGREGAASKTKRTPNGINTGPGPPYNAAETLKHDHFGTCPLEHLISGRAR